MFLKHQSFSSDGKFHFQNKFVCLKSCINFKRKIEAFAALRLEMNCCMIVSNSTCVYLSISLAFRQLISDADCSDCSVVLLIRKGKRDVFGDDLQETWWLSSNRMMKQNIVRTNEAPSSVCARSDACQRE